MSDGTCQHGFSLCVHGRCQIDCGSMGCEPTLEHEYTCDCAKRGCQRGQDAPAPREPCRGDCGCGGCKRSYTDFLDCE